MCNHKRINGENGMCFLVKPLRSVSIKNLSHETLGGCPEVTANELFFSTEKNIFHIYRDKRMREDGERPWCIKSSSEGLLHEFSFSEFATFSLSLDEEFSLPGRNFGRIKEIESIATNTHCENARQHPESELIIKFHNKSAS